MKLHFKNALAKPRFSKTLLASCIALGSLSTSVLAEDNSAGIEFVNDNTGIVFFADDGYEGGFSFICLDGDCRTGELVNGRWQRQVSGLNLNQSYAITAQIQDNETGQFNPPKQDVIYRVAGNPNEPPFETCSPLAPGTDKVVRDFVKRGDIAPLPKDLCDRLVELAGRPNSYLPLPVFAEADESSLLFGYYNMDTTEFEPNPFSAAIEGINDQALPTGANFANGGLPTIGTVRMVFEPKEDLPGDPQSPEDPAAFIDMFTDISGLFVINNEAGWYEGWLIRDLTVPATIAELDSKGINPWGTMTQADYDALRARSQDSVNTPGSIFTGDGEAVRFPAVTDNFALGIQGNTVGFPVSIGAFNALQQSDVHAYWELNPGTNWTFPLYELPFTGGLTGLPAVETPSVVPPAAESLLNSIIPEPFISPERAALLGDDPLDPRDPDRFEDSVNFAQAETRNRFIPSNVANEILLDVFIRTESFAPGVGLPCLLYTSPSPRDKRQSRMPSSA